MTPETPNANEPNVLIGRFEHTRNFGLSHPLTQEAPNGANVVLRKARSMVTRAARYPFGVLSAPVVVAAEEVLPEDVDRVPDVLAWGDELQILDSIVVLGPIDVVDLMVRGAWAEKRVRHQNMDVIRAGPALSGCVG